MTKYDVLFYIILAIAIILIIVGFIKAYRTYREIHSVLNDVEGMLYIMKGGF